MSLFSLSVYPVNVQTAEPIVSKFCLATQITQEKGLRLIKIKFFWLETIDDNLLICLYLIKVNNESGQNLLWYISHDQGKNLRPNEIEKRCLQNFWFESGAKWPESIVYYCF